MNTKIFSVLLLQSFFALLVQATIYITKPLRGTICSGGKPCSVEWLDDGVHPLLTEFGPCHVALYNGDERLVQQIDPVDVSTQHALTFTPDSRAGASSPLYYINFTSVRTDRTGSYQEFSAMFTLDSMTGNFGTPEASDTSAIPVRSSLITSSAVIFSTSTTNLSTSTSLPSTTTTGSSTGSSGSTTPTSIATSTPPSTSTPTSASVPTSPSATSTGSSSSSSSSSTSTNSEATSSGFTTSRTSVSQAPTTLTVPNTAATGSSTQLSQAPAASSDSAPASTNQSSSASRATSSPLLLSSHSMPLFLLSGVVFILGLIL